MEIVIEETERRVVLEQAVSTNTRFEFCPTPAMGWRRVMLEHR